MCQIRTSIETKTLLNDCRLLIWFRLLLKKSFTYMLAKSDATLNSIEYEELILFQITINKSRSVDTPL